MRLCSAMLATIELQWAWRCKLCHRRALNIYKRYSFLIERSPARACLAHIATPIESSIIAACHVFCACRAGRLTLTKAFNYEPPEEMYKTAIRQYTEAHHGYDNNN